MEVHRLRGEWRAVANAKRNRLQTATDEVKAMLLVDLGDIESEVLRSPETALAVYQEALALQPEDHRLMQRILDLAAQRQQWALVYEMIMRFAALENDPQRKGSYFLAAAEICRDKSGNYKMAAEHYDQCLDAFFADPEKISESMLPRSMKAFADLDAILTKERAWKQQEVAYRRMIKRLPQDHPLLASLWHSLGEIYRSRLKKHGSAIAALEVARTLAPDNVRCREELADLYLAHGGDHLEKAIVEHQAIIALDPARRQSYSALAEIYKTHWQGRGPLGTLPGTGGAEGSNSRAATFLCRSSRDLLGTAQTARAFVDVAKASSSGARPKGFLPAVSGSAAHHRPA